MEEAYDVVIVGCGMAGALAGLTALQENLSVCIVERKQRELIGKKICGELIPQSTCKWLENDFGITVHSYPLKGIVIYPSFHGITDYSSRRGLYIEEPLCTIDRWQFGQTLVKELLRRGADIKCATVKGPINETCVKGVKTEDAAVYGTVTIDCSGVFSVLRRKVTSVPSPGDQYLGVAYKEDIVLEEPLALEHAVLVLDKNVIPSGYLWCFPKSEHILNMGVGGIVRGKASLKNILNTILENDQFRIKERTNAGIGVLPLGRPLPSMVGPSLLVCGDAACQVNPLTGEGIAPALMAGYRAGKVAAQAIRNNDTSIKGMWQYNYECAKQYGTLCGPLCVLRDFLLSLSSEELTFLLEHVITSEDLEQLEKDWSPPPWRRKLAIFLASWRNLPLLYRLYTVLTKMMKIKTLYECYPGDPEAFPLWKQNLETFFE